MALTKEHIKTVNYFNIFRLGLYRRAKRFPNDRRNRRKEIIMAISGINRMANYQTIYKNNKTINNGNKFKEQLNAVSNYDEEQELMESTALKENEDSEKSTENQEKTDSKTNIIVKADGSRVLMITTKIGGMESVMSLEISKSTDMQNNSNFSNKLINKSDVDVTKNDLTEKTFYTK